MYWAKPGKKGTIVFVGGDAPASAVWLYVQGFSLSNMGTLNIYDIDSGNWLQQETTGDIPHGRYAFCMIGAGENDSGSYELYYISPQLHSSGNLIATYRFVYGGLSHLEVGQQKTSDFSDIFLLSLPSFSWTRVSTPVSQMRASHKCQVIGNRQMLVIGGSDPWGVNLGDIPDLFVNGLGIFDMSDLTWADKFDPGADKYVRPSLINDHYAKK